MRQKNVKECRCGKKTRNGFSAFCGKRDSFTPWTSSDTIIEVGLTVSDEYNDAYD